MFAGNLAVPTPWVPHPYAARGRHAPDGRAPVPIPREGLGIMAGLFRDPGEGTVPLKEEATK